MLKQLLSFHEDMKKWKLVIGSWLMFAVTISFIYSGTLLSFLASPSEPKTVETFQELSVAVAIGTHRVYGMKGTFYVPFLLNSKDEEFELIGKKMVENNWTTLVWKKRQKTL
ncbi:hypothetical protein TNIN_414331 [Trichonephila inaurata madagascariensis]|uniref:Uncharacterized protein n=1 Tax=Trichonephila inaurata madagascariensis TaxID=2747483 RepID=A0A8X6X8K7_9ARAC|nr:hypothetical protein TNIN_414331 [Trichonephila inaurata madagascariensis]